MDDHYKPTDPNAPITKPLDEATNEKFDKIAQRKVVKLLAMLTSNPDSKEFMTAARALPQALTNAGLDIYVLISRIEHGKHEDGKLTAGEMQKIYDSAYAKGHADGAEQGRRSAVIAAAMPVGTFAINGGGDVGPGVNGHSWLEIAQHCKANKHLFSGKSLDFIEDMPEKIGSFGRPTPAQAKWLKDLFMQKCGGRID
jgi:hypothetical protein